MGMRLSRQALAIPGGHEPPYMSAPYTCEPCMSASFLSAPYLSALKHASPGHPWQLQWACGCVCPQARCPSRVPHHTCPCANTAATSARGTRVLQALKQPLLNLALALHRSSNEQEEAEVARSLVAEVGCACAHLKVWCLWVCGYAVCN